METEEDPFIDLDAEVGLQEAQIKNQFSPQRLPIYSTPEKSS
jgi:hypothetical protein